MKESTTECPTPWKEDHTKSSAKRQIKSMEVRHRKSKQPMRPVEPYQCVCGNYHIAGRRTRRHH